MVQVSYPGVYVQEIPSGVRTIVGVSTSVTAFVGYTPAGPIDHPKRVFNFGEYEKIFGGLHLDSDISYGVKQFFLNGGSEAWIVRVAEGAERAKLTLKNSEETSGKNVLEIKAKSEGSWGNLLRLDVDYATSNPDSTFNLVVTLFEKRGQDFLPTQVETHRNLSMAKNSPDDVVNVLKSGSKLVTAERHSEINDAFLTALQPGKSLSGDLSSLKGGTPDAIDGSKLADSERFISIVVDGDGPHEIDIFGAGQALPTTFVQLAARAQAAIVGINPGKDRFRNFTVKKAAADFGAAGPDDFRLLFTAGTPATAADREHSSVQIFNASSNSASQILKLGLTNGGRERAAAHKIRPAQTGAVSGDLAGVDFSNLSHTSTIEVEVKLGTESLAKEIFTPGEMTSLKNAAEVLQAKIRASNAVIPAISNVSVETIGTHLRFRSGTTIGDATLHFKKGGGATNLAQQLGMTAGRARNNVQVYSVGMGQALGAQGQATSGIDGTPPNATSLIGNLENKTGIYALEDADIFNLLCIPRTAKLDETQAKSVISAAIKYCSDRRAFMVVDPPAHRTEPGEIEEWKTSLSPHKNAAVHYPFVLVPDPLQKLRLRPMPPSGTMAGLYARTDSQRGIWKAPAGTEALLVNVPGLAYSLTDQQNGSLNKLGINCLRQFPVYGRVSWGGRTLEGADALSSEWKYTPVRRLALYIEESLFRGLKWVVFEGNDEPLWAQIRLNAGSFMHNLFRQGAFQGQKPADAYLVKCDKETTTQADIDLGIVNVLVGFAPLKPAEFVILQLQLLAGQLET